MGTQITKLDLIADRMDGAMAGRRGYDTIGDAQSDIGQILRQRNRMKSQIEELLGCEELTIGSLDGRRHPIVPGKLWAELKHEMTL